MSFVSLGDTHIKSTLFRDLFRGLDDSKRHSTLQWQHFATAPPNAKKAATGPLPQGPSAHDKENVPLVFRFPLEIRLQIYHCVLGGQVIHFGVNQWEEQRVYYWTCEPSTQHDQQLSEEYTAVTLPSSDSEYESHIATLPYDSRKLHHLLWKCYASREHSWKTCGNMLPDICRRTPGPYVYNFPESLEIEQVDKSGPNNATCAEMLSMSWSNPAQLDLLRVNRQIYKEASSMFWSDNIFSFEDVFALRHFMKHRNSAQMQALRYIHVAVQSDNSGSDVCLLKQAMEPHFRALHGLHALHVTFCGFSLLDLLPRKYHSPAGRYWYEIQDLPEWLKDLLEWHKEWKKHGGRHPAYVPLIIGRKTHCNEYFPDNDYVDPGPVDRAGHFAKAVRRQYEGRPEFLMDDPSVMQVVASDGSRNTVVARYVGNDKDDMEMHATWIWRRQLERPGWGCWLKLKPR